MKSSPGALPPLGWRWSLREDLDHDAAVLCAAVPGVVRRNRLPFTEGDHVDLVQRNLVLLVELPLHRLGPLHANTLVDRHVAYVVRVPFDLDEHVLRIGLELADHLRRCGPSPCREGLPGRT